jgi:AraC-like DNA-binding protein
MSATAADDVQFSRPAHMPGVELVHAAYTGRRFPLHSHPEFVIGVIEHGAETLWIRGEQVMAPAGSVLLIGPDEAHANEAIEGVRLIYRVFYIQPDLLTDVLGASSFRRPVVSSPNLARRISAAHRALSKEAEQLDHQSAFASLAAALHAETHGGDDQAATATARLVRARDYLEANFRGHADLADIAAAADLSPFHLVRQFKRRFGLSPVAYRNQLRVHEARRLLRAGEPIAQVALDVGFADQSHLTRQFQRLVGTSPARYTQQ